MEAVKNLEEVKEKSKSEAYQLIREEMLEFENVQLKKDSLQQQFKSVVDQEAQLGKRIQDRLGIDLSKYKMDENGVLSLEEKDDQGEDA